MALFNSLSGPNSFQAFRSLVSRQAPATTNLYWVRFRKPPNIFYAGGISRYSDGISASNNGITEGPGSDQSRLLTYYATDVTVPSRQITTGDAKTVGSMYRYATGTSYSEISIQFILPRTMFTRMYFERWMNWTSNDSTQKVSWYDDYVCSHLDIFKYERGGMTPSPSDWNSYASVVAPRGETKPSYENYKASSIKFNRCSGVWVLKNAYPFNISNINLNAGPGNLLSMEVSFYYERYRFYVPRDIELGDVNIPVTLGTTGSRNAAEGIAEATARGPVGASGSTPTVLASLFAG
jgi:hypothetical protein